jgi:3'(2'), 5'-bisphosphate nucleotidase
LDYHFELQTARDAAINAGLEILKINEQESIEYKSDGSPITSADKRSHNLILNLLNKTTYSVVSEESSDLLLNERNYWLVDPLDGTKDFLAGNMEFTVNISLLINDTPILGVICAPALNLMCFAVKGYGAWVEQNQKKSKLASFPKSQELRMAVSRFHASSKEEVFVLKNNVKSRILTGSSLKYLQLAMGSIDVVPRFVGCSEWDTAAGQVILEEVGGNVVDLNTGKSLKYGKANRRNSSLISFRQPYELSDFVL